MAGWIPLDFRTQVFRRGASVPLNEANKSVEVSGSPMEDVVKLTQRSMFWMGAILSVLTGVAVTGHRCPL